ncbi:MAG: GHMP kinase [Bacteroidetes bacterium MedPE-SWsnd-G2]|nr:MAG: GHMP kinase [Bacteroidetes bacterium MedPE-SWsnd-G2]
MQTFYSNGKLLITGEYLVLDGAKALALPTNVGQSLIVEPIDTAVIEWTSIDDQGQKWFDCIIPINELETLSFDDEISNRLVQILSKAKQLNPNFLSKAEGYAIATLLDFPIDWGLGTSSTLISNIAQWAEVDPYQLLSLTFGGSGYDIACAQNDFPITYELINGSPTTQQVAFNPEFKNKLYFVHLNQKQNSRTGIKAYRDANKTTASEIQALNQITEQLISTQNFDTFKSLLKSHEDLIAMMTNQTPIQNALFNDFNGQIKSLGAWGGDFVLVASERNPTPYFQSKGYLTIIAYQDLIL